MFWEILGIILVGAGIVYYEVPKLAGQKMWRELVAFSVFFILGLALALALAFDLAVPNPTQLIEYLFEPLSRLLYPS